MLNEKLSPFRQLSLFATIINEWLDSSSDTWLIFFCHYQTVATFSLMLVVNLIVETAKICRALSESHEKNTKKGLMIDFVSSSQTSEEEKKNNSIGWVRILLSLSRLSAQKQPTRLSSRFTIKVKNNFFLGCLLMMFHRHFRLFSLEQRI